jgi:hypothetical protein
MEKTEKESEKMVSGDKNISNNNLWLPRADQARFRHGV